MQKFLKVMYGVLCILGCLLGAGFISGAEIQAFFVRFGYAGIIGIILSSIIFAVAVCKGGSSNNNKCKFNILPYCQLLISGAMLAGLSEVVCKMLQINKTIVILCFAVLLFIALVFGIKFANIFNVIVAVVAIIIMPIVAKNIGVSAVIVGTSNFGLSIIYAIFYAVINIVACMPVIQNLPVKNRRTIGILSSAITAILLAVIFILLSYNSASSSMPILELMNSSVLNAIYTALFIVAMVSTLFSASNGAKQVFVKLESNIFISACTSLAIATLSFIGFGGIINYMYPAIAIAALGQFVVIKLYKTPLKTQKYSK